VNAAVIEDTLFGTLKAKRELLVACWTTKIRGAVSAPLTNAELLDRIPAFVDEVIAALHPSAAALPSTSVHAGEHGAQRLRLHFDVREVVREYGLLHECILELATDSGAAISLEEQQVISKWINTGIADALAQYVKRRDAELERQTSEHLGFIAHELRNPPYPVRILGKRLTELIVGQGFIGNIAGKTLRRVKEVAESL